MNDPGRHLRMHRAPAGLVQRALAPRPAPRVQRTGWALAAAFLLGLLSGAAGWGLVPAKEAPPVLADAEAPPVAIPGRIPLHLELAAPDAQRVEVAGTWNDWKAEPLEAGTDGRFHLLLSLPPGRYEYMFVVNGRDWIADPRAPVTRDDGFGRRNSILEI